MVVTFEQFHNRVSHQLKNDNDLAYSCYTFLATLPVAFGASFIPFFQQFTVCLISFFAVLVFIKFRRYNALFAFQSWILGFVGGMALGYSIVYRESLVPIFCRYVLALVIFHFSEFFFTAVSNRRTLQPDSFLLNHSTQYWIAAVTSWIEFIVEAYFCPSLKVSWLSFIGSLTCIIGEIIRKLAMVHCGNGFTHRLALMKRHDHKLVTDGIYSYIRHPGYTGWFLWSIGTQIILCNPLCFVAYAYATWLFFNDRVYDEEKDLIHFFGDSYVEYQRKTWTGVPFVYGYGL